MNIKVKRIYDPVESDDGVRLLVDRLWPRAISREHARIDRWMKEIAPSNQLRKWFAHKDALWEEFILRYWAELEAKPEIWEPLLDLAQKSRITLLYAAKNRNHNNAVALREFLLSRMKQR
ncbi:MAG: DUF488 domain-containing protein [bacterium JZ-2024 1]